MKPIACSAPTGCGLTSRRCGGRRSGRAAARRHCPAGAWPRPRQPGHPRARPHQAGRPGAPEVGLHLCDGQQPAGVDAAHGAGLHRDRDQAGRASASCGLAGGRWAAGREQGGREDDEGGDGGGGEERGRGSGGSVLGVHERYSRIGVGATGQAWCRFRTRSLDGGEAGLRWPRVRRRIRARGNQRVIRPGLARTLAGGTLYPLTERPGKSHALYASVNRPVERSAWHG